MPPVVTPGSAQKAKMCILLCVVDDFQSCAEAVQEAIQRHPGRRPGAPRSHPRGYLGRPLRPKPAFYYVFLHLFRKIWTLFFENRRMPLAFASLLEPVEQANGKHVYYRELSKHVRQTKKTCQRAAVPRVASWGYLGQPGIT